MEIKILGTVSPYCKDTKNCPGYLVTENNTKIILDCGNGCTRELKLPEDLKNLTIIISHLHKDHYGDLLSLGYASYIFHNLGYLSKRIKVYIPNGELITRLEDHQASDDCKKLKSVQKPIIDYLFLQEFGHEQYFEFIPYDEQTKLTIGNLQIDFSKNPHPINTFSTRVKHNKETFVYSGDTGYSKNTLVTFAQNADLLLCEATFLNGQTKSTDHHLYAYEAATIARDADVKKLLLTHFFPELDKESYVSEAKTIFKDTEAAEEGKILKLGGIK